MRLSLIEPASGRIVALEAPVTQTSFQRAIGPSGFAEPGQRSCMSLSILDRRSKRDGEGRAYCRGMAAAALHSRLDGNPAELA
jgi:hypothetical protein